MKFKSFTLIEIILALVFSTMIAAYVIKEKSFAEYINSVKVTQDTLVDIVNNGIIGNTGYASARGNYCSDNYDFEDMNSSRLSYCNEWTDNDSNTTDRFNISSTSLVGKELMGNYGGCSFETKVLSSNSNKFDIFIDCSEVSYNTKTLKLLEESLSFTFTNTLSGIFISIEPKAETMNDQSPSGDKLGVIDGKFRVRMGM